MNKEVTNKKGSNIIASLFTFKILIVTMLLTSSGYPVHTF
ncbi:Uncharacterised protein [Sphingobacterium spiritivorum]|uniref:Uncharacterized protein n=1 Tax=Sphingobacterium spiritivorum TaxID=258 RepID=A0A380C960_SPHSI|nr:Uncharacterised protein [Sphingobacterium spiritivorum]